MHIRQNTKTDSGKTIAPVMARSANDEGEFSNLRVARQAACHPLDAAENLSSICYEELAGGVKRQFWSLGRNCTAVAKQYPARVIKPVKDCWVDTRCAIANNFTIPVFPHSYKRGVDYSGIANTDQLRELYRLPGVSPINPVAENDYCSDFETSSACNSLPKLSSISAVQADVNRFDCNEGRTNVAVARSISNSLFNPPASSSSPVNQQVSSSPVNQQVSSSPLAISSSTPLVATTSSKAAISSSTPINQATSTNVAASSSTPVKQATSTLVATTSSNVAASSSTPLALSTSTPILVSTSTPGVFTTAIESTSTPLVKSSSTPLVKSSSTPVAISTSTPVVIPASTFTEIAGSSVVEGSGSGYALSSNETSLLTPGFNGVNSFPSLSAGGQQTQFVRSSASFQSTTNSSLSMTPGQTPIESASSSAPAPISITPIKTTNVATYDKTSTAIPSSTPSPSHSIGASSGMATSVKAMDSGKSNATQSSIQAATSHKPASSNQSGAKSISSPEAHLINTSGRADDSIYTPQAATALYDYSQALLKSERMRTTAPAPMSQMSQSLVLKPSASLASSPLLLGGVASTSSALAIGGGVAAIAVVLFILALAIYLACRACKKEHSTSIRVAPDMRESGIENLAHDESIASVHSIRTENLEEIEDLAREAIAVSRSALTAPANLRRSESMLSVQHIAAIANAFKNNPAIRSRFDEDFDEDCSTIASIYERRATCPASTEGVDPALIAILNNAFPPASNSKKEASI